MPVKNWIKIIPNSLTVSRLVLAFIFPFLDPKDWFLFLIIGLLTEWLDGLLARALKAVSQFGRLLDPVADKLFVASVAVSLIRADILDPHQLALIATRDIFVTLGVLWTISQKDWERIKKMPPRWPGKFTTAFQFFLLIDMVYFKELRIWLYWLTVGCSIAAAIDYFLARPPSEKSLSKKSQSSSH